MYSIVLYVLRRGRMYSNVLRCTLLCFWSTCTPPVLRVYSSGTLPTALKFPNLDINHSNHKSPRIWHGGGTRRADLHYSIPTVLCSYSATYSVRTLWGVGTWWWGGRSIVLWRVLLVYCECTLIGVRSTVLWYVLLVYCVMYSIVYSVLQNAPCTLNVLSWAV